jgi:hypothetical protein
MSTPIPKAPPKGTAAYASWLRKYGNINPTPQQTKNAKITRQKQLKAAIVKDDKNITKTKVANNAAFKGLLWIGVARFSQTGTTGKIWLITASKPQTRLGDLTGGDGLFMYDIAGVDQSIFYNGSSHAVVVNSVANSADSYGWLVTVTMPHSATISAKNCSGRAYLLPLGIGIADSLEKAHQAAISAVNKKDNDKESLKKLNKDLGKDTPPGGGASSTDTGGVKTLSGDKVTLNYNLPTVKWNYFSTSKGYDNILLSASGTPAAPNKINDAQTLWLNSSSNKGMLQTYSRWDQKLSSTDASSSKYKDPNLPDWFISSSYQAKRYGFQFMYNPASVNQVWGGVPDVDPGQMMSGKDVTPFITPAQTASYISFDLIINRMQDMAVLSGYRSDGTSNIDYVANHLNDYYGIDVAADAAATDDTSYRDELAAIQELGTMYDIEYLLSTLIGFREYSALRRRYTADFGFLMGIPVELHLGKQLRYIGTILNLSVTHTIFTEGMVPVFTNISITFSRRVEPFKGTAQISPGGSLLSSALISDPSKTSGSSARASAQ